MPLKLLVIAEGYPHADNLAGVFHRDQLRLMAEAGLEVTVVGPTPWVPPGLAARHPRWRAYADTPRRQSENAITILRPRYPALPRENRCFWPDLTMTWAVKRLHLPKPDVILAFFALPHGSVARRLARQWQIPYLVGMLGDDVNIYPHHNARNMRLLKAVIHDAAFAFANGPTLAAEASRLTGTPVATLSIGVSPSRFAALPPKTEARAALGLPTQGTLALYVGAHIPTKGMNELAQAARALPGLHIVTVGDGPLRPELEAAGATCLGIRSAAEVAMAMAAADLHVHPSYYEGLPTALVEAALAGLPIVTTDAPGCIDLAADGRALMVPAKNAAALTAALADALADPVGMAGRAALMRRHVEDNYVLETNTARLMAALRHAVEKA